ncbi:hypothetical protein [Tsukamurella spumae]|uniref:hypothetical protein n=1 Tax=Tsukamurella spumae TaxID=44753 RepID=UPI0031DF883B
MTTVVKSTDVDSSGNVTTKYFTERYLTAEEFQQEFGSRYALKRGQKLIAIRDYISEREALQYVEMEVRE